GRAPSLPPRAGPFRRPPGPRRRSAEPSPVAQLAGLAGDRGSLALRLAAQFGEPLQQRPFLLRLRRRRFHLDPHEEIAAPASPDVRYPLAAETNDRAGLGPGLHPDPFDSVERGDLHVPAHRGERHGDRERTHEVLALAAEDR